MTIQPNHLEAESKRRAAPRLPLSMPGKFLAVHGTYQCILTNLSRTGVLIAVNEDLDIGSEGFLRCGPIDHFMLVSRREGGLFGMMFESPVSDAFVKQIGLYQDDIEAIEQQRLAETAQEWIAGRVGSTH